jgi:microcystin-dependent protein
MSDPYIGEIRIFPFGFPPAGWASCDGQLLPLSQNPMLFSLLGTTYGGDGEDTFALPNLQGRAAMHPGQGQGLSLRELGEMDGAETVTLLAPEIPVHTHVLRAQATPGNSTDPTDRLWGRPFGGGAMYRSAGAVATMASQALAPAGGGLPHDNLQPYLALNFCISMQGSQPSS